MKYSILLIILILQFKFSFSQYEITGDSIDCLERLDSKTFALIINNYICQNNIKNETELYSVYDYIQLLKINNTLNWYDKDSTYENYFILSPLIKTLSLKYKIEMEFWGMGEAGGVYSHKYNFWMGGYPRASSMFYINDWILQGPVTLLFFDCECPYPPCNE